MEKISRTGLFLSGAYIIVLIFLGLWYLTCKADSCAIGIGISLVLLSFPFGFLLKSLFLGYVVNTSLLYFLGKLLGKIHTRFLVNSNSFKLTK